MRLLYTSQALQNLRPGATWELRNEDYETVVWTDRVQTKPLNEEVVAEARRLQEVAAANAYRELRQKKYPPLSDYVDAVYWQGKGDETKMTAYLEAVEAVKLKYPKG